MVGPNTRIHYKVSAGNMIVGGIYRDKLCMLPEHEHPEAQLTIFFSESFGTISRKISTGVFSLKRLQRAINMLSDCPEREFTLVELANLCNSSVFHFSAILLCQGGLRTVCLSAAASIEESPTPSPDNGIVNRGNWLCCGFENATHFSRMFRRQTGYAPREYRRLHSPDQ